MTMHLLASAPRRYRHAFSLPSARTQAKRAAARARFAAAPHIVLVGNDPALQQSRQLLLEHAGYTVTVMASHQVLDAEDLSHPPLACDLAMLCRSTSSGDARRIAVLLHTADPQLPILRFANPGEAISPHFSITITAIASPIYLLAEVARLLAAVDQALPGLAS